MRIKINRPTYAGAGAIALAALLTLGGCKENIDDSSLYTFTGEMMTDHFKNNPEQFSDYYEILGKVHPSRHSTSTMQELLSARGNYTCFAPTNEAIQHYLDSLQAIQEIPSNLVSDIPDTIAQAIVYNSIINNQNNDAYASTDFTEEDGGALPLGNMNDRTITISYASGGDGQTVIYVNNNSRITEKDIEVENGYIHAVDRVLSPSNAALSDLIIGTDNLTIFGQLLELTGWKDSLTKNKDEEYEDNELAGTFVSEKIGSNNFDGYYPEHHNSGYTAFVETDSVYKANGITDVESLKTWLQSRGLYSDASFGDDYKSQDNAVNQFVAYHLVAVKLTTNLMTFFSNEKGYYNGDKTANKKWKTNVWEYYETMGKQRRTMKITAIASGRRINRCSKMNLATYKEKSVEIEGIAINNTNGDHTNSALNGFYYPIDDILTWNSDVYNKVLNERMRYDVCSLLPEIITNGIRQNRSNSWYFTNDYFANIVSIEKTTKLEYLPNVNYSGGGSAGWCNYQLDEFNIRGNYDFTMKLPAVPYSGTYEIRYGVSANSGRGMAQIYIGENPNNLAAYGIPLDLRVGGSDAGWVSDKNLTSEEIDENDKALRNNGYMKGPKYFYPSSTETGRDNSNCLRRIVYTGNLEAGKTYYIRFKSVLNSSTTQFFYDYIEMVPKSVYAGDTPEDKW